MTYQKFLTEESRHGLFDANSLQRVYFTQDMNAHSAKQIRERLDRGGWEGHEILPFHCLLPPEYDFFVEYKTATQYLDMVGEEDVRRGKRKQSLLDH